MAEKSLTSDQILTLLTEAPIRIGALTEGQSAAQLQTRSTPEEWCVNDILAHLRSCADVWGNCIKEILAKDKPTICAINPTTWIESTDYPRQKFQPSFKAFTAQRADLLKILKPLTLKSWSRSAMVAGGRQTSRTDCLLLCAMAGNPERTHVKQIERIAKVINK